MEPIVRLQCAIRKRIARSVVLRKRSPFYKAAMEARKKALAAGNRSKELAAANHTSRSLGRKAKSPTNILHYDLVPRKP